MKKHFAILGFLLIANAVSAQELKMFINGNSAEGQSCRSFEKDDLMRIIFTNKANSHKLRIASLLVTLIPKKDATENTSPIEVPMGFYIDNSSTNFSSSPSFTFLMLEKLQLLKYDYDSISIKVHKLESNTPEGNKWIQDNVVYHEVNLKVCPQK